MLLKTSNFLKGDEFEYKLINDLMSGYNKYARPTKNYSQTTNVTFGE